MNSNKMNYLPVYFAREIPILDFGKARNHISKGISTENIIFIVETNL